jgi:hypothetical protein
MSVVTNTIIKYTSVSVVDVSLTDTGMIHSIHMAVDVVLTDTNGCLYIRPHLYQVLFAYVVSNIMFIRQPEKIEKQGRRFSSLFFQGFDLSGKFISSFLFFVCLDVDLLLDFMNKDYLDFLSLYVDLMLDLVVHLRGFGDIVVHLTIH